MGEQSKITTQEGIAIVQRGQNVRIIKQGGDELEVNLPPVEEIIASKMPRLIADGTVTWYFLLAAWCAFFIAMTQQHRTRITELRLAEAETAAHAAQVRALRYQVNPHFLFNTLNSLSSLVMSGRVRPGRGHADGAVDLLPHQPVDGPVGRRQPGRRKSRLQRLYLDIEKVRFPDRLEVEHRHSRRPRRSARSRADPPAAGRECDQIWRVADYRPGRAVDPRPPSRRRADAARRDQPRDRGALEEGRRSRPTPAPASAWPTCRQRLEAHFGNRADVRFGPIEGGYEVSLAMPLDEDD